MSLFSIFFPNFSKEQLEIVSTPAADFERFYDFSSDPTHECDVTCPVDDVSGFRGSALGRIFDPRVSSLERERILGSLQRMPVSRRKNLSDSDLIGLTESRYNMTLTDKDKFVSYLRELVDDFNSTYDADGDSAESSAAESSAAGSSGDAG